MSALPLTRELEAAREIALEAMELVRVFRKRGVKVDHKQGDEPVTEADRAASALIVDRLRALFPEDAILSEELPDDGERMHKARVWMVDPIDGTRDFIRGDDGYAVMIGLAIHGRPQVGVVAQPPTGLVWGGAIGAGAWREDTAGLRQPLAPSALAEPRGIRLVASKSHRTDHIDVFRRELGIVDEVNIGGVGLKVALVAEGSRDLYAYPGDRTKAWDTCAPEAILHAAGGLITDAFGDPLAYDRQDLYNRRGLLASNGRLHPAVLRTITALRERPRGAPGHWPKDGEQDGS